MKSIDCLFERVTNFGVGLTLLAIGAGFSLIGITVLPVLGFLVALPVLALSAVFFAAHRSRACTITLDDA